MSPSSDKSSITVEDLPKSDPSPILRSVALDKIRLNPHQPRQQFSKEELEELAQSIQAMGVLQPLVVRLGAETGVYELISGERRFRAAQLAGLQEIHCVIHHANSSFSAQAALVENVQRVDLNPMEIAQAMKKMMQMLDITQDELAHRVGKKRSSVTNYLRLLALPSAIQESLARDEISMGHAKVILSLPDHDKQSLLHQWIIEESLSVRQTEQRAIKIGNSSEQNSLKYTPRDFFLEQLSEKIQQKMGTRVTIHSKGNGGRISIEYFSLDDLDRLLTIFGISVD